MQKNKIGRVVVVGKTPVKKEGSLPKIYVVAVK